ncbi:MAG: tetratricopeptide repeat protein [Acidobacteriota bacterium]
MRERRNDRYIIDILPGLVGILAIMSLSSQTMAQRRFGTEAVAPKDLTPGSVNAGIERYMPTESGRRFGIEQVGEAGTQISHVSASRVAIDRSAALLARADRLSEAGDFTAAVILYRQAIGSEGQSLRARLGLGCALIELGHYDAAIDELREAATRLPDDQDVLLNLGVALYRSGRVGEAIIEYQRAITKRARSVSKAYFNLAIAYAHTGDFTQAINNYQQAIAQHKNYPEAYNNLGLIYEAMDELTTAAEQFRLAIEQRGGRYPLAHYNLARFYLRQNRYLEAIAEFQLAIKQQANFPEAYLCLGNIYLLRSIALSETTELMQAINYYRQALTLRNNYPLAHENLAIALTRLRKPIEALAEYRIAFDQYAGRSPETLANLLATITDKQVFLINDEQGRPHEPGNLKSHKQIVKVTDQLIDLLDNYQELDPTLKDLPDIYYCVGRAYWAAGNSTMAIDQFARAIELSNGKDQDAKRALVSVLTLVLYF